jgi:hypothetical protein
MLRLDGLRRSCGGSLLCYAEWRAVSRHDEARGARYGAGTFPHIPMALLVCLLIVTAVLLYVASSSGRVSDVGAYLRHIFFDKRDGLVLTRWLGDVFPGLRR